MIVFKTIGKQNKKNNRKTKKTIVFQKNENVNIPSCNVVRFMYDTPVR